LPRHFVPRNDDSEFLLPSLNPLSPGGRKNKINVIKLRRE
jgi:hypothetical protein